MMVYEQITLFINNQILIFWGGGIETQIFWIKQNGAGTPEPDRTRTGSNRNRFELEPTETEPNRTVGFLE